MKALLVAVVVAAVAARTSRDTCASAQVASFTNTRNMCGAGRVAAAAGSEEGASALCAAGSDPERVARPCFVDAQKQLVVETLGARAELPCAVYGARKANVCATNHSYSI